ncbi:hypothetical protein K493DRAFT_303705 [Basidiobolus meristosporus CBS 931.73]|uniref:Uncharacterized protein n=1 Tax=Basidiobolus meristosporus CBS 931.73 TaxID=1314790 RepID=A0A1Y1Y1H9_9FUNG|nr:hypothetical protein K493DRAFT_303705 [Basidiobolus meristosporus CBS 931.73]|eukprot:ORX91871.1 hypothetical protein K493DRAFT_303705 [Basidiobolus meristosporus CBS 931.73]
MSVMNQVVSTALQLQKDIELKDHKCIAHQLALLYQCLNQVGGGFLKFKSKIETRFDKIKTDINESETSQLHDEHKLWLRNLTSEVVIDALFKQRPVRAASQPLADFLNNVAKH